MPTEDTKRFQRKKRALDPIIMGMYQADEEKKARKIKRGSFLFHQGNFRSGDGRLRNPDGKWVKDSTPNYKRKPPIKPWNKGLKLKKNDEE